MLSAHTPAFHPSGRLAKLEGCTAGDESAHKGWDFLNGHCASIGNDVSQLSLVFWHRVQSDLPIHPKCNATTQAWVNGCIRFRKWIVQRFYLGVLSNQLGLASGNGWALGQVKLCFAETFKAKIMDGIQLCPGGLPACVILKPVAIKGQPAV